MSKLEEVIRKIRSGDTVRIFLDPYGQKQVELTRAWPPARKVVQLRRADILTVQDALDERGTRGRHVVRLRRPEPKPEPKRPDSQSV